jgi:hypothetical protein
VQRVWLAVLLVLAACDGAALDVGLQSDTLRVVSPSSGGATPEARPWITWTRVGTASYRLRVYADAALGQLLEEQLVTGFGARLRTTLVDGQVAYAVVEALDAAGQVLQVGEVSRFKCVLLPPEFPRPRLVLHDAPRAQGGYKLFNLTRGSVPIMGLVNEAAEVVWWYRHPGEGGLSDARVLPNGNLTFIVRTLANEAGERFGTGYEITWDGQVVWQSRPGVDVHHELGPGPGGNYLYLTWVFKEVAGVTYEGDGLELVDPATNQVLWEWNIFDHYDPADWVVPEAERPGLSGRGVDWSHANAAVWDPDRSLIWVSVRHFDHFIGIDYPSGQIAVVLGNRGLGGPDLVSHSHAPEVQADGSLLFFDNGNTRTPQFSSARIITFDAQAGTTETTFVWHDTPPFYDRAVGDADRQPNGNILVTAGVSGRIIEITPQGDKVWELAIDDPDTWFYRTQQVDESLIPPTILP